MSITFTLSVTLLILLVIFVLFAGCCKNKFFSYIESDTMTKTPANEVASSILNKYSIQSDICQNAEHIDEEENENNEDEIKKDLIETSSRTYENLTGTQYRVYEKFSDEIDDNIPNIHNYNNIKLINGKCKYGYSTKNDYNVYLSEDLLTSASYSAVLVAGYKSTEMCENISKSFVNKLLSIITFIPKIVNQISWIIALFAAFNFLFIPTKIINIILIISIICFALSCLHIFYCFNMSSITYYNLNELGYIDESEKHGVKKLLNLFAISESTNMFKAVKWFMNKIMGYSV